MVKTNLEKILDEVKNRTEERQREIEKSMKEREQDWLRTDRF